MNKFKIICSLYKSTKLRAVDFLTQIHNIYYLKY